MTDSNQTVIQNTNNEEIQMNYTGMDYTEINYTGNVIMGASINLKDSVDEIPDEKTAQPSRVVIVASDEVNIPKSLENVRQLAKTWYARSTKELYGVLGQCYELYYLIETADQKKRDNYRDTLKGVYEKLHGSQGARQIVTRIVSIVFDFADMDRQTRSRYGSVIKAAHESKDKVTDADSFVRWLESKGGIIAALNKSDPTAKQTSQAEINEYVTKLPARARLKIPTKGNRLVVLLATPIDSETVEIVYVSDSESLADKLAQSAYNEHAKKGNVTELRLSAAEAAENIAEQCDDKEAA